MRHRLLIYSTFSVNLFIFSPTTHAQYSDGQPDDGWTGPIQGQQEGSYSLYKNLNPFQLEKKWYHPAS